VIARALLVAVGAACAVASACAAQPQQTWQVEGGDARRGQRLVVEFGCAGCHTIPRVRDARGNVGPPLTRFADRTFIAGMLRNDPDNLLRWLRHPQSVVPGNAMPDTGLSDAQARDIAAFLYTLH
jgi:cytochrome c2